MKAIDLFAGWGGFSTGAANAGIEVVWAANHWALAVDVHTMNHPATIHACQDLRQADWSCLPQYDILLAAPACQGHSSPAQPARKKNPLVAAKHDQLRATAWAVVDCADVTSPELIVVENVPEFRSWRLYPVWKSALQTMGYHIQEQFITASMHGVPQRRRRLFVVCSRHEISISLTQGAEPAFGPCIEWEAGQWRSISKASPAARDRILAASARHGERFLTQHVSNHPGVPLSEPVRTITTKDQWAVVRDGMYRPFTLREYARAMGFPDSYRWPQGLSRADVIKGLGNAVCPPVAKDLLSGLTS